MTANHLARARDLSRWRMWAGAAALLVWYLICAALGASLLGPLVFALQVALVVLLGYAIISFWRPQVTPLTIVVAGVLGLELSGSLYSLAGFAGVEPFFYVVALCGVAAGAYRLTTVSTKAVRYDSAGEALVEFHAMLAGIVVMLAIGSAYYFSGRPESEGYVFYGPMARDHVFHLALIGRLKEVIPPDNFVVSGFAFPGYHFFPDAAQLMFETSALGLNGTLDIYYRLYPGALLFTIGFLAYWVPARMFASRIAGAIGAAIIIVGADLSWVLGALQTVKVLPDLAAAKARLFEPWTSWTGFSALYPLVHRPAYYHGLVAFLAGLACVTGRAGDTVRAWATAGLIWGLMAGFNYTLAVTMGVAVSAAAAFHLVTGRRDRFRRLATCAAAVALGSIPVNAFIAAQWGAKAGEGGASLSFAPGALANMQFSNLFAWFGSPPLAFAGAVVVFIVVSYGVKLAGLRSIIAGRTYRDAETGMTMTVILVALLFSFSIGFFLENDSYGGAQNNIILFQPTVWFLGLFAVLPLAKWVRRGSGNLRRIALGFVLLAGGLQALPAFGYSYKVVIDTELASALRRIRQEAASKDVVGFYPDKLTAQPILAAARDAANFYYSAFTGLRAYHSTSGYTENFSRPGPSGREIYRERVALIKKFMDGTAGRDDVNRLAQDDVRWLVLPGGIRVDSNVGAEVWQSSGQFTMLKLNVQR